MLDDEEAKKKPNNQIHPLKVSADQFERAAIIVNHLTVLTDSLLSRGRPGEWNSL
jgi:hypothetical protein